MIQGECQRANLVIAIESIEVIEKNFYALYDLYGKKCAITKHCFAPECLARPRRPITPIERQSPDIVALQVHQVNVWFAIAD